MKSVIVFLLFGLIIVGCQTDGALKNKVIFKDDVDDVQDAIVKMTVLLKKLPKSEFNTNYAIANDSIAINNGPGREDSVQYYTQQGLSVFNKNEKTEFIRLSKYLNENFIDAGYIDYATNLCLFSYRDKPQDGFNESRLLVSRSDFSSSRFKKAFQVLDTKNKIMLVASSEAIIR